ncbi:MAG: biopolymer transporter ExbD [Pseudomonadota bacterium]
MPPSEFAFDTPRHPRKPSLTPMIDVVFLLLVFFMLAARFGMDMAIPLQPAAQGSGGYTGAPRLVSVTPEGVLLNGAAVPQSQLAQQLRALMPDENAIVVVKPVQGATLQAVVDVLDTLSGAKITRVVLAE